MPSSLSAAPPTAFHAAAAPPAIDVMFAVTSAWTVCLAVTLHSPGTPFQPGTELQAVGGP